LFLLGSVFGKKLCTGSVRQAAHAFMCCLVVRVFVCLQAAVLRRQEAQLLLQAETLRGSMAALHDTAAAVFGQQQQQQVEHHQQEHHLQEHQQQQQQQLINLPEQNSAGQMVQQQQPEVPQAEDRPVMLPQQGGATEPPFMQSSAAAVTPCVPDTAAPAAQPASLAGLVSHPLELDSACGTPTGVTHNTQRAQGTRPE
jgi:hypothetical protein